MTQALERLMKVQTKPPILDTEFELVRPRRQFSLGRFLWFWGLTAMYAATAYNVVGSGQSDAAELAAVAVVCAACISPVVRFLSSISEKVSPEEAQWLARRMVRPKPASRKRQIERV